MALLPRWPFGALVGALLLASSPAYAQVADTESIDPEKEAASAPSAGLVFGPKLLYYPVECQDVRGCRLECFQNGVSVVARGGISPHDEVRLVVNAGISDEIQPRWIEIKPVGGDEIQTILLTRDSLCDFRDLIIFPRHQP